MAMDRDALLCDFAETYHLYDFKVLPQRTMATLAAGLRADSRIKLQMSKCGAPAEDILLSSILDGVNLLVWMQTKDGRRNKNRPQRIASKFFEKDKKSDVRSFSSAEDFEAAKRAILGR